MDENDLTHRNDAIKFTEDDLLLHKEFYTVFEKWNNMTVKKATDACLFDETLFDGINERFRGNEGKVKNLANLLSNNAKDYDKLIQMNLEVENEESNLQNELENVKAQISELERAKAELENNKELDMIKKMCKISKLFTGTIFNNQGSNISGIISTLHDAQSFNFDGAQEDICKQLWQAVALELGVDK